MTALLDKSIRSDYIIELRLSLAVRGFPFTRLEEITMALRTFSAFMTFLAMFATPFHVGAQNEITSANIGLTSHLITFSPSASEKALLTIGHVVPAQASKPPETIRFATYNASLNLIGDNGELLTDFSALPRLTIPFGGFRSVRISATGCAADGDNCNLMVEVPDSPPYIYEDAVPLQFGRVALGLTVVCETAPCGPGVWRRVYVVGPDGETRAATIP
jgi:hypothetical protein